MDALELDAGSVEGAEQDKFQGALGEPVPVRVAKSHCESIAWSLRYDATLRIVAVPKETVRPLPPCASRMTMV